MSTLRKITLFAAVFSMVTAGIVFSRVSYAALPPSTPNSGQGVVPYRITPDIFPNNTGSNTCQVLASIAQNNQIPGWAELDLTNAVGRKIDSSAGTTSGPVTTTTDGTYLDWTIAPGYKMVGVVMKGGTDSNFYNYANTIFMSDTGLASPPNSSGNPAGISHYNICYVPDGGQPTTFNISGMKFFDINADGVQNDGEFPLGGFVIRATFAPELSTENNDVLRVTAPVTGAWSINGIPEGTDYLVMEDVPTAACDLNGVVIPGFSWVQTAPAMIQTVEPFPSTTLRRAYQGDLFANVTGLDFGNRCQRQGTGGYTLGFWSNRNGKAIFESGSDLAEMVALNLRNASGAHFNPTDYASFRTWLLGANATNMAYMLSAQYAASKLNVYNGFIVGDALLDVNGEIGTLNDWFAEAQTSLGNFGSTLSGDSERANQERLKNIFDAVNNNNFVIINTDCRVCTTN